MCEVHRKGFTKLLLDNEEIYFGNLLGVIESIDEYASLEISKTSSKFYFRLVSSLPKYNEMLLQEILKLNNLFKIKLELSKSIKVSTTICFNISLDN